MAVKKAPSKLQPSLVTIDRKWQIAFIVSIIGAQAIIATYMMWTVFHYAHHFSFGLWSYQIMWTLGPLLFLIVGWLFSLHRVRGTVPRLFWGTLLATVGVIIYSALQIPVNDLLVHLHILNYQNGANSWWLQYGFVWTQYVVMFLLYTTALTVIAFRGKRR